MSSRFKAGRQTPLTSPPFTTLAIQHSQSTRCVRDAPYVCMAALRLALPPDAGVDGPHRGPYEKRTPSITQFQATTDAEQGYLFAGHRRLTLQSHRGRDGQRGRADVAQKLERRVVKGGIHFEGLVQSIAMGAANLVRKAAGYVAVAPREFLLSCQPSLTRQGTAAVEQSPPPACSSTCCPCHRNWRPPSPWQRSWCCVAVRTAPPQQSMPGGTHGLMRQHQSGGPGADGQGSEGRLELGPGELHTGDQLFDGRFHQLTPPTRPPRSARA